jgi:Domain of unknown function (DUF4783)
MKVCVVMLLMFASVPMYAQVRPRPVQPHSNLLLKPQPERSQSHDTAALLKSIEEGILSGSSDQLHTFLAKQVSMTIGDNQSGYYSAGQASLILQNFFSTRKPTHFAFTRTSATDSSPYATGRLTFLRRGNRNSVQVYVALGRQDARWVITQFNIY